MKSNRKVNKGFRLLSLMLVFIMIFGSVNAWALEDNEATLEIQETEDIINASWRIKEAPAFTPFDMDISAVSYDPNEDITHAFIDPEFLEIIRFLADLGPTDPVLRSTVDDVWYFEFRNSNVSSIKGIEYFISLKELVCRNNELTVIDLSENSLLEYLDCRYNNIINTNRVLGWESYGLINGYSFHFSPQNITDIDITKSIKDKIFLQVIRDKIGKSEEDCIYISDVDLIEELHINSMEIKTLDGIEYFTELEKLYCHFNLLNELELTKNKRLKILDCSMNDLTLLDVTGNYALEELICFDNMLSSLDLTNNPAVVLVEGENNWIKNAPDMPDINTFFPHENIELENVFLDVFSLTIDADKRSITTDDNMTSFYIYGNLNIKGEFHGALLDKLNFYEANPGEIRIDGNISTISENEIIVGTTIRGGAKLEFERDYRNSSSNDGSYAGNVEVSGIGERHIWIEVTTSRRIEDGDYDGDKPYIKLYTYKKVTIEPAFSSLIGSSRISSDQALAQIF
ncbi:MAG: hypothetical protein FWG31_02770 [Oscillospiraceae bacterium]|nr:hypothetical protein [Oscillospiraceae bacterium]